MADMPTDIDAILAEAAALAEEAAGQLDSLDVAASPVETSDAKPAGATATLEDRPAAPPMRVQQTNVPSALARVLKVQVPVVVRLAQRGMALSDILNISVGTIIEFEKSFEARLDLLINNEVIGNGQAVKTGEKFGLRISEIGGLRDRVDAIVGSGGQGQPASPRQF